MAPPREAGRRPKAKAENPISSAVRQWVSAVPPELLGGMRGGDGGAAEALVEQAPKRWVVYEPAVLLPSGSFAAPMWTSLLSAAGGERRDALWAGVLGAIGKRSGEALTHLAANEGIPLHVGAGAGDDGLPGEAPRPGQGARENVVRSPSGLRTLYGGFGPPSTSRPAEGAATAGEADFDRAFWVSTRQNGVYQTWAPRWTMFSRGNVKEKARLLGFHGGAGAPCRPETGLGHRARPRSSLKGAWAVDLYAGIGYFAFSYAKLGMRVLCWEINPWSVEGLRRGAQGNGWSVKVVGGDELRRRASELVTGQERIVVFLEDNKEAERRIAELRAAAPGLGLGDVLHVNCGLLPRSDDSWRSAYSILRGQEPDGWLHLHENVGAGDIEGRRQEIQATLDGWWTEDEGRQRAADVEHVELVKTFAPGVWHCVFDVRITSPR